MVSYKNENLSEKHVNFILRESTIKCWVKTINLIIIRNYKIVEHENSIKLKLELHESLKIVRYAKYGTYWLW